MIEYKFGNVQEYDIPSPTLSPVIEELSLPHNALPDYVPSYFPPFPEIKEDEVIDEVDRTGSQKQQQLEEQKLQLQQNQQPHQITNSSLPLPVIVKNRKKPIENPFTHIIPFEESSLASENEDANRQEQLSAQPKPLSLLLKVGSKRSEVDEQESARKRRKAAITPLTEALQNMKDQPEYRLGEGLADRDELFKAQTRDAAAPGNYLFNHDSGVFDELVRNVTEPLVISKVTAPNLLIDIHTATSNTPAPVTPALFEYGAPGSMMTSPDGSKLSRSASMLAVLAGGASSKKAGLKQLNKLANTKPMSMASAFNSSHTISKHSIDINAIKTGDSKYIIKKKRMLAERQQALERQKLLEQQMKDNPNGESLSSSSSNASSSASTPLPLQSQPQSLLQHQSPSHQNTTISNSPSVATTATPSTPTKPMQHTGPISLSSFSSNTAAEKEKKQKKKTPKLMLNISQNPLRTPSPMEDTPISSPSAPKIRFKIKPPEQQPQTPKKVKISQQPESLPIKLEKQFQRPSISQQPVHQQPTSKHLASPSMNNGFTTSEEIRCICENPTVDYGTFMIACDKCGVWFHGSCVGIAESDQVEEWYCRRCRR